MVKKDKLKAMLEEERKKVAGYKELMDINMGFIAILLKKIGAVSIDTAVQITKEDINEAVEFLQVNGTTWDGGYKLFCPDTNHVDKQ